MLLSNYVALAGVRANLVQDNLGSFVDETGSSRGISNGQDLALLKHLRSLADVVVTDGETARLEKYKVPIVCDLAVITRVGYKPEHSETTKRYVELLKLDLPAAIGRLKELGYASILLETGPELYRGHWQLVDELCLTATNYGVPNIEVLGIQGNLKSSISIGESTFSVWTQIRQL